MRSGFWMPLPAATSRQLLGAIRDRVSPGFTVYGVLAPATPAKPTRPTVAMAAAAAARRRIRVRKGMSFCWGNPPQLDARTPGHGRWFPVRRPCRRAQRRPQGRGGQCPTTYRHQGPPCVRSGDYSLPPLSSLFRNLRHGLAMSSLWDVDNETAAEPLVGRAETIAGLEARLFGPEPRGVVLAGAPGAGRTAVARELVCRAGEHGVDPVLVTATRAAARVPLGAVAPLLPAGAPAGAADGDQASLLRGTLDALAERARDRRLLVVVDDAHLLDDVSATLVHHVAADGTAVVLATVRAREPAPDPLVALWKDELCERVELHPLDAEGTGELVREVLGGAVDPASVVQLVARSQGNVLFLRELVAAAVDDGRLHDDGGIWRLEGELTPSARLTELVERPTSPASATTSGRCSRSSPWASRWVPPTWRPSPMRRWPRTWNAAACSPASSTATACGSTSPIRWSGTWCAPASRRCGPAPSPRSWPAWPKTATPRTTTTSCGSPRWGCPPASPTPTCCSTAPPSPGTGPTCPGPRRSPGPPPMPGPVSTPPSWPRKWPRCKAESRRPKPT